MTAGLKFPIFLLLTMVVLVRCQPTPSRQMESEAFRGVQADTLPEWMRDAVLYEVNVRQYTAKGTFAAFRPHLARLKEMGVKTLLFMPVFPVSEVKGEDYHGEYVAVRNLRGVNASFGGREEFRRLVREIRSMGMYVMIDWVIGYTGWDHPWITDHPEYYIHDPVTDTIIHPINTDWYGVAALDYDNSALAEAMIAEMTYWVEEMGINGFRFERAGMVPVSFWERAIPLLLNINPDLFLLGDTGAPNPGNVQLFHADVGWAFKDLADGICQGQKTIDDLNDYLMRHAATDAKEAHLYFTSSDQENSWEGTEFERLGQGAEAMYILAATLPGIPMIYSGQEEPLTRRLRVLEKDNIAFKAYGYAGFYSRLNELKRVNSAIHSPPFGGDLIILEPSNPATYAYTRQRGDDRTLIVLNLSSQVQETRLDIGDWHGTYRDVFRGSQQVLANPLSLQIGPWGYLVLSNR